MAIKLRVNQPTALTYTEMDRNFSSFFYSASVDNGNLLKLWYTGSIALDGPGESYNPQTRVVTIDLQPTTGATPTLTVAGTINGHIQIKNGNILGYDDGFIYNNTGVLGIGINAPSSQTKVHIRSNNSIPAVLRLESTATSGTYRRSSIQFYQGANTIMGTIGRDNAGDNNIYIKTYVGSKTVFPNPPNPIGHVRFNIGANTQAGAFTNVGFGIGTLAPSRALHVEGGAYFLDEVSIGTTAITEKLLVNGNISTELIDGKIGFLVSDSYITGSGTYAHYGLSKITGENPVNLSGYFGLTFATVGTERMRIDKNNGYVGINTIAPSSMLDVNGDTTVTGSFTVTQNATVKGNLIGQSTATISGNTSIGGTATVTGVTTLLNIPQDVAGANTKILTATAGGQIQYITSIFPKGGIVMWSGTIATIPTGWQLCNGTGTVNGNPIPDLRERFIVGAGGDNADVRSYNFSSFVMNTTGLLFKQGTSTVSKNVQGVFTKVNETTLVNSNLIYTSATGPQEINPYGQTQYALYSAVGSTPATSYFLAYDMTSKNYRLYNGAVPSSGTSIAALPYYELPQGSIAVLSEVGDTVVFRPNFSILTWQENTTGYTVGDKGGFNNVKLGVSELPSHRHTLTTIRVNTNNFAGPAFYDRGLNGTNSQVTDLSGGDLPHENRPPYYALAFIIYTGA